MKKVFFSLFLLFLGIALLYWILNQVGWQELRASFLSFSAPGAVLILTLGFLAMFIAVLRWREILKSKGYSLSLAELSGNYLASFAIIYLAPMITFGGELFRGYLLKEKNEAGLKRGMAASFTEAIFEYFSEFFIVFLGLSFFFLTSGLTHLFFLMILIFFLAGSFAVFLIIRKKSLVKVFLNIGKENKIREMEKEIFLFFKLKSSFFQKALFYSLLRIFVRFSQYWALLYFLAKTSSFSEVMSIFGISILAMLAPVSADIGVHDIAAVMLFKKLGIEPASGVVLASMVRGVNLALAFLGICFLLKSGLSSLRESLLLKIEKLFNKKGE